MYVDFGNAALHFSRFLIGSLRDCKLIVTILLIHIFVFNVG